MAIAASSVTPSNSLEDFRIEFNNLVSDVTGITATNKFTENIIFEGATADAYETTLTVTDPTADRTVTLPNETGTVFTSGGDIALGGSITKASDLTVDIEGDISLDANGGDIYLKDGGTIFGTLTNNGGNLTIKNSSAEVAAISIAGDEVVTFADDIVIKDGGTIGASSATTAITIASTGNITLAGTLQATTITATTAVVPDASDGAALGTTALEWSDLYLADGAVIGFGDDQEVTLTHVADTGLLLSSTDQLQFGDSASYIAQSSDGVLRIDGEATIDLNASTAVTVSNDLKLDSDAAVLGFGADNDVTLTHVADTGVLLNSTMAIQFNDASQYINAPSNAILDINATDEIELNATLADVNANLDVSGTYTGGGLMTTGGNIVIPDAGTIGSASDTDAFSISSGGVVNFTQNVTMASALTVTGTTTLNGALVLGDAAADTLTVNATLQGASPLTFEGGTADGHETTFAITDPTADRTITFPNLTGTVSLISASETLTNKTLTTPTITAGVAATSFDMNGTELILDADADTSLHCSTDDQIDIKVSGADDFRITANTFTVLSGSTLTIASGATLDGSSGTLTGFASEGTATALAIALG